MDTPTVKDILEMGFSKDLIKAVIETQLTATGLFQNDNENINGF